METKEEAALKQNEMVKMKLLHVTSHKMLLLPVYVSF